MAAAGVRKPTGRKTESEKRGGVPGSSRAEQKANTGEGARTNATSSDYNRRHGGLPGKQGQSRRGGRGEEGDDGKQQTRSKAGVTSGGAGRSTHKTG